MLLSHIYIYIIPEKMSETARIEKKKIITLRLCYIYRYAPSIAKRASERVVSHHERHCTHIAVHSSVYEDSLMNLAYERVDN